MPITRSFIFLPYPETQEFVNVGVVLMCADERFFDFRIETRRRDRVTGFFPELGPAVFIQGRRDFGQELQRVRRLLTDPKAGDADALAFGGSAFRGDVSGTRQAPRGTVPFWAGRDCLVRESTRGTGPSVCSLCRAAIAPARGLSRDRYGSRLTERFRVHDIVTYRLERLGNDEYHVLFPFVRRHGRHSPRRAGHQTSRSG